MLDQILLQADQAAIAGQNNRCIDLLFDSIFELIWQKKFGQINDLFKKSHLDLHNSTILTLASVTHISRKEYSDRKCFLLKAAKNIQNEYLSRRLIQLAD